MSATLIADLSDQVQKFWSPNWKQELIETNLLPNLVSKEFEGEIKQKGDTVYVTQVARPTGQRKATGSGNDTFVTEKLTTSRISLVADQTISAAYELESLLQIQTDLERNDSVIKANLMQAMAIQLNTYLYSFVNATTPIAAVTDFNATQMIALRKFAGTNKWGNVKPWYVMADASYWGDVLGATTLTSADHVSDQPVVSGQIGTKRFGFNMFEDTSQGLINVIATETGTDTLDVALAFHPDFLHAAIQVEPEFEIASLVGNKQFGFIIVAKMVMGAVLGHDSAVLHQTVFNT